MDDELESFCISSPPSRLDVIGGMWAESLERERRESKARREAERARLDTMLNRMRDSVERLRSLETRRKTFEAESKSFYGELAKVRRSRVRWRFGRELTRFRLAPVSRTHGHGSAQDRFVRREATPTDAGVHPGAPRLLLRAREHRRE